MAAAEKTMDESLAEDWAAIREKYAVPEETTPKEKVEEPEEATEEVKEPEASAEGASEEPTRDDKGRFVAKTGEDKGEEASAPKAPSVEASSGHAKAPSSWRPGERELWGKISPEVRAAIHRRESDFLNGQQQILPDAQLGKSLRAVIEPYRMLIEAEGGTPERAVESLLRTAAIFRVGTPQQKWEAYAQVGRQFLGIDVAALLNQTPGQVAAAPQPSNGQGFHDPRVDQLLARQQQTEAQAAQREQAGMEATVSRFMEAKDSTGEPKYPYITDVINEMSALIPQIREANPSLTADQALEEGYQRAVWAHPEIRTILQQKAASDLEARRRAESQTRTREAKRAASVNVPRRASLPGAEKPGTLEETIAATARELGLIS